MPVSTHSCVSSSQYGLPVDHQRPKFTVTASDTACESVTVKVASLPSVTGALGAATLATGPGGGSGWVFPRASAHARSVSGVVVVSTAVTR